MITQTESDKLQRKVKYLSTKLGNLTSFNTEQFNKISEAENRMGTMETELLESAWEKQALMERTTAMEK